MCGCRDDDHHKRHKHGVGDHGLNEYCETCPVIMRMKQEDFLLKQLIKGRIDVATLLHGAPWLPSMNYRSLSGKYVFLK